MGRKSTKVKIRLSDGERERLEKVAGHPRSLQKHAWRARIVLELGSGHGLMETARRTGMSKQAVWRWWDRFLAEGVDGLLRDATRPPGKKPIGEDRVKAAIDLAMSPPPAHARHWTVRALADKTGVAVGTMHRILKGHGLRPHQVKTFKVSRDPRFELKVATSWAFLVSTMPDHCVNVSRIMRRPGLHLQAAGTAIAVGKLNKPGTPVHVILDNVSSHRSAEVHEWLKSHPDWTARFGFKANLAAWMPFSPRHQQFSVKWSPRSTCSLAIKSKIALKII